MSEAIAAVIYAVLGDLFAWIAALFLAAITALYIISLIVDALSPAELAP